MQLNATLQPPFTEVSPDSEWEVMNTPSDSEDTSSYTTADEGEEEMPIQTITEHELWRHQILSGERTAWDIKNERARQFKDADSTVRDWYEKDPTRDRLLSAITQRKELITEYKLDLHIIKAAHDDYYEWLSEMAQAERSQQYTEMEKRNKAFKKYLSQVISYLRQQKEALEDDVTELMQENDVSKIDHPRHKELTWTACYTNNCLVHYAAKTDSGYWPTAQIPVYWDKACTREGIRIPARQTSKN